MFKMLIAMS